jgi:hypothetical protein
MTSYEFTTPSNLNGFPISVTPNVAVAKSKTSPAATKDFNDKKAEKSPSSSRFITWNAKSLLKKAKAEPRHTVPNSPNYTDVLDESNGDKSKDDTIKPIMLRGRSRSVSTTKEMASMVSANRAQHHEKTIHKLSEMFTLRKDTSTESTGLKPITNDLSIDVFSDGNGIVFKKKSMIKRIFTGRKHRQHPEGVTQRNNMNNRKLNNSKCILIDYDQLIGVYMWV